MRERNNRLNAIESNSVIDVWKREYNETSERIEAGYATVDAYQPLKQKINTFLDEKLKQRKMWKKAILIMTIVVLLLWGAAFIASRFYDPIGDQAVLVAGQWAYRKGGIINDEVMDWLMIFMLLLPVIYIAFLFYALVRKMKCEKVIYDAMTFDKRYFSGDICRLRNNDL